MATHLFWAPQTGNNANSGTSLLSPKKDFSSFGTFSPDTIVFGLNGEIHDGAAQGRVAPAFNATPTAAAPWTLMAYPGHPRNILDGGGTRDIGFRPAAAIDQANGPNYVTIQGFEIRNYTSSGVNYGEVSNDGTNFGGNGVRDCYVHDIGGAGTGGVQIWGTHSFVEDTVIDNVAGDGIFGHGASFIIRRCTISRVSNTGGTLGDSIQLNANSHNSIIDQNYIDHTLNEDKQAVLVCGNNCIISNNTVLGLSVGAGLVVVFPSTGSSFGNIITGNYLLGRDGIALLSASGPHYVYGNVCIGTEPTTVTRKSVGIDVDTGLVNHVITNNTVINHRRGYRIGGASARNNIALNNLITGFDTQGGAIVEAYNCAFGNGTNFSGTPGTRSIQVDPQLRSNYMPQNEAVLAAGLALGGTDFYGVPFGNPPTIGAVQFGGSNTLQYHLGETGMAIERPRPRGPREYAQSR